MALRGRQSGGETNSVLAGQVTWFSDTANNRTIIQMDDADADLTTDMMIVLHGVHTVQQSDFVM